MKTAVPWQDIIDTLDTMTPKQLQQLARELLARIDPPTIFVLGEQVWPTPDKPTLHVVSDA